MKFVLPLLVIFSVNAFAAPGFCKKMECGTYEGLRDGEAGVTTTIEITGISENRGHFLYTVTREGQKNKVWDLNVRFRSGGRFDLDMKDGYPYAAGMCQDRICTYGMHPFPSKDKKTWGNAGILQFKDGGMDLHMTVGFPDNNKGYLTQLTKK